MASTLHEHLSRVLGRPDVFWDQTQEGEPLPCKVVRFRGGLLQGVVAFTTLGLSEIPLPFSPEEDVFHELLMLIEESEENERVPGILAQIAGEVLSAGRPLLRGQVLGPRERLVPGSEMAALFVDLPSVLPASFFVWEHEEKRVIIAWLVPISAAEADLVRKEGWEALERMLIEQQPRTTDLRRASML